MPRSRNPVTHDAPSDRDSTLVEQLAGMGRLMPYLWPADKRFYKVRIVLAFLATLAGQFMLVGGPILFGKAIDALAVDSDVNPGLLVAGGFIVGYGALQFFSVVVTQIREYLFTPVGQLAQRRVATETFAHMHRLSLRYHLQKRTGGLSRIIERGIRAIDFLFRFLIFNIGPTLLQLGIVAVVFAFEYNWQFSVIALVTVILYFWFTVSTTEWRLKFRRDMNRQDVEANSKAVDSLINYETVKYFNAEGFETSRYDHNMEGYQEAAIKSKTSLAAVNIGQSALMNIGLIAALLLAGRGILSGEMQIGDITAISLIMSQLYRPLNILGFAYREIKQSLVDMEKMFGILDLAPEVQDKPGAPDLVVTDGAISFDDVDFRYESDRPILKGVSFHAAGGERIAVVGQSGAGKSTLSRILYRFYEIKSGAVTIDGQDIRDVSQDSLRRAIGIVPQDTVLFNDSIGYNIAYARPGCGQEEIEAAARAASIHDFIMSLPKGYDTVVGERGLKLSGGEKQRVAIARTILKNPPILILDEATSALDSETEQGIQSALDEISKSRTTLVIAHRLSTITGADRILVMRDGEIIEQGRHGELLAAGGAYADLWMRQQESSDA